MATKSDDNGSRLVLLTGATGYVGGRLLRKLQSAGYKIRCACRDPSKIKKERNENTEWVQADVLQKETLGPALADVHTAYYLVHSMGGSGSFSDADRRAATDFGEAAREAGVKRIIYLGGLGDESGELSEHLRSRIETGECLRAAGVPVTELRASIIIGPGSLSFEMVRALVERLPVMITPRWVDVSAQPIAISDILDYLQAALEQDVTGSPIYEIGGEDRVSYGGLMREYARQRGLRRLMIRVPVLTPRLSSLWLGLVTPLYARVGRLLIDGVRHATVVRDTSAHAEFPIRPKSLSEAIADAIAEEDRAFEEDVFPEGRVEVKGSWKWGGVRYGNRILDSRERRTHVTPEVAFTPIERIGGSNGWYYGNWLWKIRGLMDRVVGGVGLGRGRRDPDKLEKGDYLDWWRVEEIHGPRRLRLRAEMKVPGRAWLQFDVFPEPQGSRIRQTAIFDPAGLTGLLYWYILFPVHCFVFAGMLRGIVNRAEAGGAEAEG